MNEQSSNYDPMSMHDSVSEIYTSPEMLEHARLMRSISRAAPQKRYFLRRIEIIHRPDLFGGPGWEGVKPPISPDGLNNDAAAEDVIPVVDNS
jgi:hypothetical protein